MDSCDKFIKNINIEGDIKYILTWFDSIIALYNIVGKYDFLSVKAESEEGDIVFTLESTNNAIDITSVIGILDNTCITVFSRIYNVEAFYNLDKNNIIVKIKGIPI